MSEPTLRRVTLTLCESCIDGAGGECHTPGCALWMNRAPDVPLPVAHEDCVCVARCGDRDPDGMGTCKGLPA